MERKTFYCRVRDVDILIVEPAKMGTRCILETHSGGEEASVFLDKYQVEELIEHLKTFKPTT